MSLLMCLSQNTLLCWKLFGGESGVHYTEALRQKCLDGVRSCYDLLSAKVVISHGRNWEVKVWVASGGRKGGEVCLNEEGRMICGRADVLFP